MSRRDVQAHGGAAESFVGRCVFVSVATNTLKLMMDSRHAGPDFLWIDPPWMLLGPHGLAMSTDTCPLDHDAPDYGERFRAWAALAAPLEGMTLEAFHRSHDGGAEFHFSGGLTLVVPADDHESDEGGWYDHWYARTAD